MYLEGWQKGHRNRKKVSKSVPIVLQYIILYG